MCVNLRMGRGRYQNSPTAVPHSSLTPDWTGEPHADDFYSIALAHEGYVSRRSRVCKRPSVTEDTVVIVKGKIQGTCLCYLRASARGSVGRAAPDQGEDSP